MYSRNSVNGMRYSPPPGYAGNSISNDGNLKHHLPSEEVKRRDGEENHSKYEQIEELKPKMAPHPEECRKPQERDVVEEILSLIKGKFGSEELIILAVMLLIAQEGIGVEVLILALVLIAG